VSQDVDRREIVTGCRESLIQIVGLKEEVNRIDGQGRIYILNRKAPKTIVPDRRVRFTINQSGCAAFAGGTDSAKVECAVTWNRQPDGRVRDVSQQPARRY
jgi:hypothetical protein